MTTWEETDWIAPRAAAQASLLDLRRLNWLIRLRWIFIGAFMAVLEIERWLRPQLDRPRQIEIVLVGLMLVNLLWWGLQRRLDATGRTARAALRRGALALAHAQIAVDLLVLTLLIRFTGGVESPLAIFYVFHMVLGSLLLPAGHALAEGAWAMALYGAVLLGELGGGLTPHYPLLPEWSGAAAHQQPSQVGFAFAAVACGVLGTLYLTGTVAALLLRREGELRASNAALQQSQRAIRDLQARRSRFMQTAAHRLKSPLATIRTLAGLVCDDVVHGPEARATCGRITRCCDEGIEHVGELLTLARVQEVDPRHYRASLAHVGDVVRGQFTRYQAMACGRAIDLTLSLPAGVDLHAAIDPRDLGDCVGNLIDNAIKYTADGGKVAVSVERVRERVDSAECDWVLIKVDDTGMGFDPDALAQCDGNIGAEASVFDAYRRGNNALAAGIPGSGLGLAIVRVVMEQAGGRIHVRSAPGSGTQFSLKLPSVNSGGGAPAIRNTAATHVERRAARPEAALKAVVTEIELTGSGVPGLLEVDHAHR